MRFGNGREQAVRSGAVVAVMAVLAATGLASGAAAAQETYPPSIDELAWPGIETAYCTFMRADRTLVYDDPQSWKFVLVANFPGEEPVLAHSFMLLDGQLRELRLVSGSIGEGKLTFAPYADPDSRVDMKIAAGEGGEEYTNYSGTLTYTRAGSPSDPSVSVDFQGGCGV